MNLCFDIGGKSLKYCFFDKNNKMINKDFIKFDNFVNATYVLKVIKEIIEINKKQIDIKNICISSPGVVDSITGNISGLSAIIDLEKMNFKKQLQEYNIPIFIENDSKCAALAELKVGNGVGYKNFVVIVIGTGIGGAIIVNNQLYKGSFLGAGEFGCILSKIEDNNYVNLSYASSMNFVEQEYFKLTQQKLSGKNIYELYYKDQFAKISIDKQIFNISSLILNLGFILDPELVLLGGAVSQNQVFLQLIKNQIDKLFLKSRMIKNLILNTCKFYNDANLIGANLLISLS